MFGRQSESRQASQLASQQEAIDLQNCKSAEHQIYPPIYPSICLSIQPSSSYQQLAASQTKNSKKSFITFNPTGFHSATSTSTTTAHTVFHISISLSLFTLLYLTLDSQPASQLASQLVSYLDGYEIAHLNTQSPGRPVTLIMHPV